MLELVYITDLKSVAERIESSNLSQSTTYWDVAKR